MATDSGGCFRETVADEMGPWATTTAWAAVVGALLALAIDSGSAFFSSGRRWRRRRGRGQQRGLGHLS